MKLIDQAILFRKLAAQTDEDFSKFTDEELYHDSIKNIHREQFPSLSTIILNNRHKPYFKLEDFLPRIWEIVDSQNWLIDSIRQIRHYFRNSATRKFTDEILAYVFTKFIEQNPNDIKVDEYLEMENVGLPPEILRKAQIAVIKYVSAFLRNDEDSSGAYKLAELIDNSKKLPKHLLINLAKHYGEDIYVNVMNNANKMETGAEILKKPKLTKYDIAYLFSSYLRTVGTDTLKSIIERADDRAKEYIRRYLFENMENYEFSKILADSDSLFMLSEDMTPMNIEMQQVNWPTEIKIMTVDEIPIPEIKDQWTKLFNDFNIIPLEY